MTLMHADKVSDKKPTSHARLVGVAGSVNDINVGGAILDALVVEFGRRKVLPAPQVRHT